MHHVSSYRRFILWHSGILKFISHWDVLIKLWAKPPESSAELLACAFTSAIRKCVDFLCCWHSAAENHHRQLCNKFQSTLTAIYHVNFIGLFRCCCCCCCTEVTRSQALNNEKNWYSDRIEWITHIVQCKFSAAARIYLLHWIEARCRSYGIEILPPTRWQYTNIKLCNQYIININSALIHGILRNIFNWIVREKWKEKPHKIKWRETLENQRKNERKHRSKIRNRS